MGLTNIISGLGSALYELPKKAVSYASLSELDLGPNCESVKSAKGLFPGYVRDIDGDAKSMHTVERMQEYAINAFDRMESYFQIKNYLLNCGVDPDSVAKFSDKGRELVDTAYQLYEQGGIKVPFTGEPILMTMAAGGILAGIYAYSKLKGKADDLFYKPK